MMNEQLGRALRYGSFLFVVAAFVVTHYASASADVLYCEGGSIRHCETEAITVCTDEETSEDPTAFNCEVHGQDTCNDYCGGYASESSRCESGGVEWDDNLGAYCAEDFQIMCDCMDLLLE